MKTTLIILTLLAMGGLGIYYATPKQSTVEVSVMHDVTSKQLAEPEAGTIFPFFNLDSNTWGGALFRYSNISDVSLNQTIEATLPSQNEWLSNAFGRKQSIKAFNGQVKDIIVSAQQGTLGRLHSSVYLAVAAEANHLAQSTAKARILMVYSDLMENSDISFYKPKTLHSLKTTPDAMAQYFASKAPLGNLKGVEIYLIYQPANPLEDYQFRVVSTFYKQMLEAAGAKVTIAANLQS